MMTSPLLWFLMLFSSLASAQVFTEPALAIYRGNTQIKTLVLPLSDALQPVTAFYYGPNSQLMSTTMQPLVSRAGQTLLLTFVNTSIFPGEGFCEVKIAGQTRWNFRVVTSRQAQLVAATPPPTPPELRYLDLYSQLLTYLF